MEGTGPHLHHRSHGGGGADAGVATAPTVTIPLAEGQEWVADESLDQKLTTAIPCPALPSPTRYTFPRRQELILCSGNYFGTFILGDIDVYMFVFGAPKGPCACNAPALAPI